MRISSFLSFFFSFHHFSLFSVVFHCFFNVFHCFALFFIVFNHPKFISIQNWNSYFRPLQLKSRLFTAQNFVCSTPVPCFLFFENSAFQLFLISKYWGLLQMKLACCKLISLCFEGHIKVKMFEGAHLSQMFEGPHLRQNVLTGTFKSKCLKGHI